MNQNRIRRTTPKSHPQFFIRRSEIAFDERVRYVESVCQVLIESRFGPGRVDPVIIDLSDRPELEEAVFYDLSEDGEMIPCYALSPHGRAGYQVVEAAYRRAMKMGFVAAALHRRSLTAGYSSNLGRGSP
ncbi:MAG: hypothetical protein ACKVRN_06620 [Pyrinomonadaceae bacterium]